MKATPGVESAALVNYLPLGGSNSSDVFLVEGETEPPPGRENEGRYRVATPDYFQTMRIPIVKGRAFTEQDKVGAPAVVIVNETLAQTLAGQTRSESAFVSMGHRIETPGWRSSASWRTSLTN